MEDDKVLGNGYVHPLCTVSDDSSTHRVQSHSMFLMISMEMVISLFNTSMPCHGTKVFLLNKIDMISPRV